MYSLAVYLSLGSTNITINNTEILITDIGEDAEDGLPSLTCHTDLTTCCRSQVDNNGEGGLGQWHYPNGELVEKAISYYNYYNNDYEEYFYFVRNAPQLIRLARRNNSLTPTGSYCCTIPTTLGDMTLCANLSE